MSFALVIGAGPAGLMAAEELALAGHSVVVCEGKATVGRKFLMAGKSGLNVTKAEDLALFQARFVHERVCERGRTGELLHLDLEIDMIVFSPF